MQAPKVDERYSQDLATELHRLVVHHSPKLSFTGDSAQMNEAMIQVFARFGEIVIERLNRAPEKNFLAFLQLLGATNLPPRAARVPITFYLGNGALTATVPERTQVAAQQLAGEKDPVLFETESELTVLSSRISSLFIKDGAQGLYSDLSSLLPQSAPTKTAQPAVAASTFRGQAALPHEFYIALPLSSPASVIDRLLLNLHLGTNQAAGKIKPRIEWRLFVPPPASSPMAVSPNTPGGTPPDDLESGWLAHEPASDTTEGLSKSGQVVFAEVAGLTPVMGIPQGCWLLCRLLTPVGCEESEGPASHSDTALHGSDLPTIQSLTVSLEIDRAALLLDGASFNNTPLDLTKDFYPFGDKPKFGDTFYFASREVFSSAQNTVVLHIELTNPIDAEGETPVARVAPHAVKLAWEFWDGRQWSGLGISDEGASAGQIVSPEGVPAQAKSFHDSTSCFSRSGDVTLSFPSSPAPTSVASKSNCWIRVRLIAGNYGQEAHRQRDIVGSENVPASFAPPMIRSVKADYVFRHTVKPQSLLAYNDFAWTLLPSESLGETTGKGMQPFQPVAAEDARPALYFGFDAPSPPAQTPSVRANAATRTVSSLPVSMYIDAKEFSGGMSSGPTTAQQLDWQYSNGSKWASLSVRDDTAGLSQPGLVRFITPPDFNPSSRFGITRSWLRAIPSTVRNSATIAGVYLNTVMATGSVTHRNEIVGVSNGTRLQRYALLQKPVLTGQRIEVLEPHLPSYRGLESITAAEGDDSIQSASTSTRGSSTQVWIRWHEVADFYASGPRDRHYILDRLNASIHFGDGTNGRIPPRGGTVRAAIYRSGGGAIGNRPTGNVTQLKTSVPYVTAAWNWLPADGGGDSEENSALLKRATRTIRHGNRAVTAQDYEDLACLATPEVARAKCFPELDLLADPDGRTRKPGLVSVIVVPRSNEPRPVPESQLLECVLGYLQKSSPPTVQLSVVSPSYVHIDVTTEIVLDDPENAFQVRDQVGSALSKFLHPLFGGLETNGWPFGRMPHKSDLYRVIARIPNVSYIRSVESYARAERVGIERAKRFLISPGHFDIRIALSPKVLASTGGM